MIISFMSLSIITGNMGMWKTQHCFNYMPFSVSFSNFALVNWLLFSTRHNIDNVIVRAANCTFVVELWL